MAVSEKGIRFLDPLRDLDKVELLHSHAGGAARAGELVDKKMNDQIANQAFLSSQYNLPFVQLPQRRRLLSLITRQSSPDAEIKARRLPIFKEGIKGMDLSAMSGTDELEVQEVMVEGGLLAQEEVMEKKKLLVELAGMNSNSKSKALPESFKAFHESSKALKAFRESSPLSERVTTNPSRVCRFCRREFPSGRALGGHMRVHGALLDAHTLSSNSVKMIKQEKQKQKQNQDHDGKLRSNLHEGKDMLVASTIELSVSSELEERDAGAGMLCSSGEREGASFSEEREVKTSSEVNSETPYDQKLDANSAHMHPSQSEQEGIHDVLNLSYFDHSSGFCKSQNSQLPAEDCAEYALSFDSKKHPGLLYELRRNPKPNQRFIKREPYVAQMNGNCHSNPTSAPLPTPAQDQTHSTSSSPERARPCSECGKVFFSWKALFGHMRCHPEREWRGIQRPDSSAELDHTARMITLRQSVSAEVDPIELGYGACNVKSNYSKAENRRESTQSKEQNVHSPANMQNLQEGKKTAAFATHSRKGAATSSEMPKAPRTVIDADCGMHKENKDKNVSQCTSKIKHEASMHAHIEEMTDDWSPSWPSAGKRSKRRRLLMHSATQPTLTSETISNEIGFDENGPEFKDQDDLDMANCLVLLSNAVYNMQEIKKSKSMESTEESAFSDPDKVRRSSLLNADQWEEEGASSDASDEATEDDGLYRRHNNYETKNNGSLHAASDSQLLVKYQCSTCKKCFNSHQALGGHRASHRKMKGCFARMKSLTAADYGNESNSEENDSEEAYFLNSQLPTKGGQVSMKHLHFQEEEVEEERAAAATASNNPSYKAQMRKKFKGHECSICHRIFATGQALGGHKRCHWTGEKAPQAPAGTLDTASVASSSTNNKKQESSPLTEGGEWGKGPHKPHAKLDEVIDLNLPAPLDEEEEEMGFDAAACGALTTCATLSRSPWNPAKVVQIPQVCSMQTL